MYGEDFVRDGNVRTLYEACTVIESAGACDRCPLKDSCLDVASFMAICENLTADMIDEFLGFSDDIENPITEADIIASYADMARKAERDEYYD